MANDDYEVIAIRALGFLASDSQRFERFLSLTGMTAEDVSRVAATKPFLKGVLEHILGDESLLLVFCTDTNTQPDDIYPAARGLGTTGQSETRDFRRNS